MATISPTDILAQWLAGSFLTAMIAPYIQLLGDAFWMMLYLMLAFSIYYKSRSFGVLAVFNLIFAFALIYNGVMTTSDITGTGRVGVGMAAQLFAYGLAGLTVATAFYRAFISRS